MTERLNQVCVPGTATLREALEAIDRGGYEMALVVAEDRRLVGIITDGNARRAILGGASQHATRAAGLRRTKRFGRRL